MMEEISKEKVVAKNTVLLYIRLFITMGISLYTSRVVLSVLGIDDFGIYTVVAGFISLFSILSDSLSQSVSRFMSIALGNNNLNLKKQIFSSSVNILLFLTLIVLLLVELIGKWYISEKINVPPNRINILNIIFQLAVANFSLSIFKVAFTSLIFAHEEVKAFTWLSLVEVLLKLVAVILLIYVPLDKLVAYVASLLVINLVMTLATVLYCVFKFEECRYSISNDINLLKQMLSFSGWNLLGRSSWILSSQGINLLMNSFFGVSVNAARGIATQVDGATSQFVTNLMIAINPQIIKSYAAQDTGYMKRLICKGSKFAGYIALLYTVPLVFEARQVLQLWLGVVPDKTVIFMQLTLVAALFSVMTQTLNTAIQATGNIRGYQIITSLLTVLSIPLSYLAFYLGGEPMLSYVIVIVLNILLVLVNMLFVNTFLDIPIVFLIREILLKIMLVGLISSIVPMLVISYFPPTILRLISVIVISLFCLSTTILTVGTNQNERAFIINNLKSLVSRIIM